MRLLLLLASVSILSAAQGPMPDAVAYHDHIPLAAVPTSIADALVPSADRQSRIIVKSIWLVNTNDSTVVTVTITCKTSGAVFIKAAIPGVLSGGNNVPVQLPADGVSCEGGVRWVADGADVAGGVAHVVFALAVVLDRELEVDELS